MEVAARFAPGIGRVARPTLLACAAAITVVGTPHSAFGQEDGKEIDCESVCRVFPDRAPPRCGCEADITGSSSGGGASTFEANPIAAMEEEWRRQTASVENYTVVQRSELLTGDAAGSPLGPTVVQYYEKEMVEGRPSFRRVGPAELSLREAEATGTDVNVDAAAAMGQMVRGLTGTAESDAEGEASSEVAPGIGIPLPTEQKNALRALLGGVANFLEAGAQVRENINNENMLAEVGDQVFDLEYWQEHLDETASLRYFSDGKNYIMEIEEPDGRRYVSAGSRYDQVYGPLPELPADYDDAPIPCKRVEQYMPDIDLGGEFENYVVYEAGLTVCEGYPSPIHEWADIRLRHADGMFRDDGFGVSRVRGTYSFWGDAPFVPKYETAVMRIGEGMESLQALSNGSSAVVAILTVIEQILVNAGPPTQQKMAETLGAPSS